MMAHALDMFGLSVLTGTLADRIGRPLTIGGSVLLVASSLLAPLSLRAEALAAALFMRGLGWNLCYSAGAALLADILAPAERGQIQGATELVVNLASGASSLCSEFILASISFSTRVGAALALVPLALRIRQLVVPIPVTRRV
jgi:MFS family permease